MLPGHELEFESQREHAGISPDYPGFAGESGLANFLSRLTAHI